MATDLVDAMEDRPATRRAWGWVASILGVAALGYVLSTVIHVVVWRSRWRPGIDALRWFHKRVGNSLDLRTAGKANHTLAALHHVGRASGREYVVPVWAHRVGQSFYIGLPYGTAVDWLRNIRAAGGCDIDHDGVRYHTGPPVVVPADEVPDQPARLRRMFDLMGITSFARVEIGPSIDPSRG